MIWTDNCSATAGKVFYTCTTIKRFLIDLRPTISLIDLRTQKHTEIVDQAQSEAWIRSCNQWKAICKQWNARKHTPEWIGNKFLELPLTFKNQSLSSDAQFSTLTHYTVQLDYRMTNAYHVHGCSISRLLNCWPVWAWVLQSSKFMPWNSWKRFGSFGATQTHKEIRIKLSAKLEFSL